MNTHEATRSEARMPIDPRLKAIVSPHLLEKPRPRYYDIIVGISQSLNDEKPSFQRCLKVLELQRMKHPGLPELDTKQLRKAWQDFSRLPRSVQ